VLVTTGMAVSEMSNHLDADYEVLNVTSLMLHCSHRRPAQPELFLNACYSCFTLLLS
jgi:hypothetical protein